MDTESQLGKRKSMSNNLYLTKHFIQRYKERVSKRSAKVTDFAKNAYCLGRDIELLENNNVRRNLQEIARDGITCKIYRGFVCWFYQNRAITVYPISGLEKRNKEYYE